jgi:signal transduction histidine kinase
MADLARNEAKRMVLRVSRFGDRWEHPFERDMGPSMYAWGESPAVRAPNLPPELRELPIGLHALRRTDSVWHVAVASAMDGRVYVVYDSTVIKQQARRLDQALLGIVLCCTLLALLISGTVARWLTTPLNTLIERLARWVPGSSVDETAHANEADRLMEAFNRAQDQLDAAIAGQRELSANLHHEVRTPLTVIRSDAEIMLMDATAPAQRTRLARIVRSVQEIEQSLESTYRLAHARFDDASPVNLRQGVEDIFESLQLEARKAGLAFENAVAPAHEVLASRQALMTVMRNIIRNAVLHAAPATLVVESMPQGLRFTDSGPGTGPTCASPASRLPPSARAAWDWPSPSACA